MFGLAALPYEVTANIVSRISFDDVFSLAATCRALSFLLREESICKSIIQTKIPFSNEAQDAMSIAGGDYSRSLRRCAKRRHAFRMALPFSVVTVGFCDTYLYCKGLLCYTLDDRVRILDLHHSSQDEIIVSIPGLLTQALLQIDDHRNGVFQVLYCADHILSCLYKSSGPDATAWLVSFNARFKTIVTVKELDSTDKIFVRHNKQFIYYGTHSEIGVDGYRKWIIHGFDIETRKWFDQKIPLPDMVGAEIGSTICFEFYNNYFYALSNQTSFEVEEIDWTSFYHVFRFPLASPCKDLVETTENVKEMWRRQHQEGPIDDRWTSLRLDVDEETNDLQIIESRKEWHLGASRSQRTYYTTPIKFTKTIKAEEDMESQEGDEDMFETDDFYSINSISFAGYGPGSGSSSGSASTPTTISAATGTGTAAISITKTPTIVPTNNLTSLPDGPIIRLLRSTDRPLYIHPPPRLPQNTHPSNDSNSSSPNYTLANSRLRTYQSSCSTFIDLVNDPLPSDWQHQQRLRLRVGGRRSAQTLYNASTGLLREPSKELAVALKELYVEEDIRFWPNKEMMELPGGMGEEVNRLLNPPSCLGAVEGVGDDRGMIYVTGDEAGGAAKAINWISFDPGVKLVGLKRFGEVGGDVGVSADGDGHAEGVGREGENKVQWKSDRKGKEMAIDEVTGGKGWAWRGPAMYRAIGIGFWFGM